MNVTFNEHRNLVEKSLSTCWVTSMKLLLHLIDHCLNYNQKLCQYLILSKLFFLNCTSSLIKSYTWPCFIFRIIVYWYICYYVFTSRFSDLNVFLFFGFCGFFWDRWLSWLTKVGKINKEGKCVWHKRGVRDLGELQNEWPIKTDINTHACVHAHMHACTHKQKTN